MELKSLEELKKNIDNNTNGFSIIIYGQEKNLIKESINLIYDVVKVLPELNLVMLQGDTISYDEVVNACETLPIISQVRIVHIKNPPFLVKKNDNDTVEAQKQSNSKNSDIIDYLNNYVKLKPQGIILLISCNEEINIKNKVVSSIKSKGYSLEFKILRGEELYNHVTSMFEKYGKKISRSDLIYFLACTSNSIEQIEKEIQKLCSYTTGEVSVTKKHIDEIVHKTMENNIFKMVDSISIKNADNAILILDTLLFQKEEPLKILGMIIRQYRILYMVYLMIEQRKNLDEMKNKLKLQDFAINNFIKQSKNYDAQGLKDALGLCFEADYNIKTSRLGSELILETLIVKLCK